MLYEPSSPTAACHILPAGLISKPLPLTPYRGALPALGDGGAAAAAAAGTNPVAAAAIAAAGGGSAAVGGAGRHHHLPAPPIWDQALELEKRLRAELRKKSFWDHDVRRLRGALQGTYEALLFGHYEFSCAHEVEPNLWKAVFYKPIEEFRSRTRALEALAKGTAAAATAAAPAATTTISPNGAGVSPPAPAAAAVQLATPEEARAQLARTTGAYLRFLDDALAFYRKTVWKLQWVHGSVGAVVDLDAALQNEIQECVPRATGPRAPEVRQSVHRCLIYLGDLCRYQSMALKERPTSARPLWERAMSYYRQAARVLPGSGNPYNQMAVMSYYTNDELRAVYYYFRSLAVAMPFATARENLMLLFEKNRNRYGSIAASHAAAALQGGHEGGDSRAAAGHVADVSVRFVRLHGMLFDKINLHQFPEVLAAAMHDLEALLGHPGCRTILQKAPEADQLLFHLAIMNIFSVHNVTTGGGVTGGGDTSASYAAAAKRAELLCYALAVAMRFAAAVTAVTASMAGAAAAAGGVGDVDTGFGAVSTACHVMLAWMVSNPEVLSPKPPGMAGAAAAAAVAAGGGGSEAPPEVVAEVTARSSFLVAAARLASHLSDLTRRRAHDQDWQDPAVRHRSLPEDSELVGFGPLMPVVTVAATWPAASEASGGAAVLAVRVARMLQALRHLDDALGPGMQRAAAAAAAGVAGSSSVGNPSPHPHSPAAAGSPWQAPAASAAVPPPGSSLSQELLRAARGLRNAVAQATAAHTYGPQATASHGGHQGQHNGYTPGHQGHGHGHGHQGVSSAHGNGPAAHGSHGPAAGGSGGGGGNADHHHSQQRPAPPAHGQQQQLQHQQQQQLQNDVQPPPQQQLQLQQVHNTGFHYPDQRVMHAVGAEPAGGGGRATAVATDAVRTTGMTTSSSLQQQHQHQQQQQQLSGSPHPSPPPPPLPRMLNGSGAAATAVAATTMASANNVARKAQQSGPGPGQPAATIQRHRTSNGDSPTAAAAAGATGGGSTGHGGGRAAAGRGGDDDVAEDEIVYQPPRPGSALPRPLSVGNGLHRRSSSGGGGGSSTAIGDGGGTALHSQDGRCLLSKQPSGSSAAPPSLIPSRDASRDGSSSLFLRSPSVLSTGDLANAGGAPAAAAPGAVAAAAAAAAATPWPPQGLLLNVGNLSGSGGGDGGRRSGSGLASPASGYGGGGGTLPPSPQDQQLQPTPSFLNPHPHAHPPVQQQLLLPHPTFQRSSQSAYHQEQPGWGDVFTSGGSGGGGGGGSGTGMAPAPATNTAAAAAGPPPAGSLARPTSPAVGELPGAGTIGLLQNLLHGGGGGGLASHSAAQMQSGRRISAGGSVTPGVPSVPSAGFAADTSNIAGGAGGGRPASSGSNAVRRLPSAASLGGPAGAALQRPASAAAAAPAVAAGPAAATTATPGLLPHPTQVLQLDHSPPPPLQQQQQLLLQQGHEPSLPSTLTTSTTGIPTVSAPFAGLPASLQQRAQQQQQQQHQYGFLGHGQGGVSGMLLLTAEGQPPPRPSAAAAAVGLGLGRGPGPGQGITGPLELPYDAFTQPQGAMHFGGVPGGNRSAGGGTTTSAAAAAATFSGLPVPLGAQHSPSGAVTTTAAQGQLCWPAGGGSGIGGGLDVSSYFNVAAGNYQAAALAEATAEATAVAIADELLQAMDEDELGAAGRNGGGGGNGGGFASYGGGAGGSPGLDDFIDAERFSPPAAAAAAALRFPCGVSPVARERSAGSDALFVAAHANGSSTHSGGGPTTPGYCRPACRSSGSGSGAGFAGGSGAAAAAIAAAATGRARISCDGDGPATLGAWTGATTGLCEIQAPPLKNLEGFGSWGVVPAALPERLGEYHQRLRCSSGVEARSPPLVGQAPGPPWEQHATAVGAAAAAAGGVGGGGVFGEDLSCLSFLAALQGMGQMHGAGRVPYPQQQQLPPLQQQQPQYRHLQGPAGAQG